MIDTHTHLDFPEFDEDREEVISRAFDNGVKYIINIGVDLERSRKSIEIAEKHEKVFAAVGLHPDYFTKHATHNTKHDWISKLKKLAKNGKVVAIGETGLDYFRIGSRPSVQPKCSGAGYLPSGRGGGLEEIKENQKKGFLAQVEIAKELGLPVIVHCREAWEDLYDIISNFQFPISKKFNNYKISKNKELPTSNRDLPILNFVLHCYGGEERDTEKFLKFPNVYFSFSGNITYPKPIERTEKLAEAVKIIPLERMMLDSDSPLLAPQEFRGKRNEPMYIRYIVKKIDEIKGKSVEEVEKVTDRNAEKFFKL